MASSPSPRALLDAAAPLSPRRLLGESLPIVAVLLVWTVLSWLVPVAGVSGLVRDAGAVMAGLYAVVRGVALADDVSPTVPDDVGSTLRLNVPVVLAAGTWFVIGALVHAVEAVYRLLPLVGGLYGSPATPLAQVAAGTGLGVVVLYAVAVGLPAARSAWTPREDRPASREPSGSVDDSRPAAGDD